MSTDQLRAGTRGITASDDSAKLPNGTGTFQPKRRKLGITVSSSTLDLKVGKGALVRTGRIGRKVKLKVRVQTPSGTTTTTKVVAKAG